MTRRATPARNKLVPSPTPVELYSALNAPLMWGGSIGLLFVASVGGVLLWASLHGKCWIRHMSGMIGVFVQGVVGAIFFTVSMVFNVYGWIDTVACRTALREGSVTTVSGILTIDEKFEKPGYGSISFRIDDRSYTTHFTGKECDCGYIKAIGRTVEGAQNQMVKAKIYQGVVLSLEQLR